MYTNKYLYFILSPIYLFGALWLGSNGTCLRITPTFIFALVFFVIFMVVVEMILMRKRSIYVVGFLDTGNPEKFLEEIEKDVQKTRGRLKDYNLINKSAGLFYLGKFHEALDILNAIQKPQALIKLYKQLYVNNKLANLLGLEKVKEAQELTKEHQNILDPLPENKMLHYALKSNLGVLEYFLGNYVKARVYIEESIGKGKHPMGEGVAHYYLGLIDIKESKYAQAAEHFNKTIELAPAAFVHLLALQQLSLLSNRN